MNDPRENDPLRTLWSALRNSGPVHFIRQIVTIEERSDVTLLGLSCGHTCRASRIFRYNVGHDYYCIICRDQQRREESK